MTKASSEPLTPRESPVPTKQLTTAFVGAPNSGKTSLYNQVTGSSHRTVNYPGATVDYSIGQSMLQFGESFPVIDTPGTYSLSCKSEDEEIARRILFDGGLPFEVSAVICVVDCTQLSRHLILARQLVQSGFPVLVALTMIDLVKKSGCEISIEEISKAIGCPVLPVNGLTGEGVPKLVFSARQLYLNSKREGPGHIHQRCWAPDDYEKFSKEAEQISKRAIIKISPGNESAHQRSLRIDHWLLHPLLGLFIFLLIMFGLFSSIFWMAAPFMDFIDESFATAASHLENWIPYPLLSDFISNGLVSSLGAVLVFVPQIFILFFGFGFLEDSGYLARAATLIDRPLSKIGLNGRSFVPLLSGYACAIPAMMAARTISSRREKLITLFTIPLMSCSARLPVYGLLLALIFWGKSSWAAGLAMTLIYLGSFLVGALASSLLSFVLPKTGKGFFMMELPYYRRPHLRNLLRMSLGRTSSYVRKAGPIIFGLAVGIWALSTFPNYKADSTEERFRTSYAANIGHFLEPVMEPMGGDWRTGVSLFAAFAAREVFVPSLAVILNVSSDDETEQDASLLRSMQTTKRFDGSPLFNLASVAALIVFFMIALQCISTFGIAVKEFGGWKWPSIQLISFNLAAYILAVAIYQSISLFY